MSIKPGRPKIDPAQYPYDEVLDKRSEEQVLAEDCIPWEPETVTKKIPPFVPRTEWGARPPKETVPAIHPLIRVYLTMYTETEECLTREACVKTMQELQRKHMDDLGYSDIKYNFLIGGDGSVYEGRGWHTRSCKDLEFNPRYYEERFDIAYIGDFRHVQHPPIKQLEVGQDWITYGEWLKHLSDLRDVYRLSGEKGGNWPPKDKPDLRVYEP